MTDYKPRPGVDALTRDGRRVTGLEVENDSLIGAVEIPYYERMIDRWDFNGKNISTRKFDLVADAPPLPEAQPGPVRTKTVKEIVPGVYGRVALGGHLDGKAQVGFTHKNIKRLDQWDWLTRSELLAAAETLRQIAEAMDE